MQRTPDDLRRLLDADAEALLLIDDDLHRCREFAGYDIRVGKQTGLPGQDLLGRQHGRALETRRHVQQLLRG